MDTNKDKGNSRATDKLETVRSITSEKKEGVSLTPQKEEEVIEKEKTEKAKVQLQEPRRMPFALLAGERKLTAARQVVLKRFCKWDDSTRITAAELDAAIRKHLKGEV